MAPAGLRVPPGGRWHGGEGSSHQTPRPTRRCLPSSLHAPCSNMQKKKQNPGCEATACGGASAPPALPLVLTVAWFFFLGGRPGRERDAGRSSEMRAPGTCIAPRRRPRVEIGWKLAIFFCFARAQHPTSPAAAPPKRGREGRLRPSWMQGGGQKRCPPLPGCSSELNER